MSKPIERPCSLISKLFRYSFWCFSTSPIGILLMIAEFFKNSGWNFIQKISYLNWSVVKNATQSAALSGYKIISNKFGHFQILVAVSELY